MNETEDDPWAALRDASRKPEAGKFAYTDTPSERAQASVWAWLKLILRVDFVEWLKKQVPLAKESLDSSYYLGINRHKKVARNTVKVILGKEAEKTISRIPVIIFGRRVGNPGLILATFSAIVVLSVFRAIFKF